VGLVKLTDHHKYIAQMFFAGLTFDEVCNRTNLAPSTVRSIKADPLFKAYNDKLVAAGEEEVLDVRRHLAEMAPKAAEKLSQLLNDKSSQISLNAAKDILDRAGFKPVEKRVNVNADAIFESNDLEEMKVRFQAAKESGLVASPIDITPSDA